MEAFLRAGADFITAIERVDEAINAAGSDSEQPAPAAATERVPTASDNDRALAELQSMMGGVR